MLLRKRGLALLAASPPEETKTTQKNGSVQSEEAGYINPVFSDAECKSGATAAEL